MPIEPEIVLALLLELETAIGLLKHGLAALESLGAANDFYHLPLLHLANGSERLCKCVLILDCELRTGALPTQRQLKAFGHDVEELASTVVDACYPASYLVRPAAVSDKTFLERDPTIHAVLACLADFGKGGRYYDLDTICGSQSGAEPPEYAWQRLESRIARNDPALQADPSQPGAAGDPDADVSKHMKVAIERFARALCRLFTIGPLRSEGRRFSGILSCFLSLMDDDLGATDYRESAWRGPYG